ncbi:hypothetical protein N7510_003072 [Penicillium lagena]|uniref:uncharacterized protein n=1 Tax=Penicillium lagena TaxID=94218 RepID=UPI00254099D1|nr:uncharacterized protein N7510_003072 [Penicillium lagena]KAJ5619088.1 hypothetical protein N7510_003072 [Penicillium lagena]
MSRMWEVDPETKTKVRNSWDCKWCGENDTDQATTHSSFESPRRMEMTDVAIAALHHLNGLASPKFGTFICLNCAGTHRGLGVHISFVRSITMDAFKHAEIQRMELGGNEPWKSFYDNHPVTVSEGRTFEDSTIKERYEGDAGEEWKERLSCKVEGREYVLGQEKKNAAASRSSTPLSTAGSGAGMAARSGSPATSLGRSDSQRGGPASKKEQNESYFAKLGSENATRSDALPPSQGGKFTGFGGGLPPPAASERRSSPFGGFGGGNLALDDLQKDPMGTLTKGFGWFASTIGKGAKTVNDSYLQPTAKQLAESDFAAQARTQAASWGQNLQAGAKGAADQFNRFVEGEDDSRATNRRSRIEPERRDFWDDFSSLASEQQQQPSGHQRSGSRSGTIGTAAMRKGPVPTSSLSNTSSAGDAAASSGTGGVEGAEGAAAASTGKGKEDWDENW